MGRGEEMRRERGEERRTEKEMSRNKRKLEGGTLHAHWGEKTLSSTGCFSQEANRSSPHCWDAATGREHLPTGC